MNGTSELMEKLRKLMAHEQSARAIGSIKEAEAFASKIQHLLSQHKLTMSDMTAKKEEEAGVASGLTIDPRTYGVRDKSGTIKWLWKLAYHIAKCNDCEAMMLPNYRWSAKGADYRQEVTNRYYFVGVEADRKAVEELFVYMAGLAWDMAKKAGRENREDLRREIIEEKGYCHPGNLSARVHDFRHSFAEGFAASATARLSAEREKMKQQALENKSTALMVIDRRAVMLQDWKTKVGVKLGVLKAYGAGGDALAYAFGYLQGNRVALTSKVIGE